MINVEIKSEGENFMYGIRDVTSGGIMDQWDRLIAIIKTYITLRIYFYLLCRVQ